MGLFDEDLPIARRTAHAVGEDLSRLSVDELGERIELLEAEIERLREARSAKAASLDVAASFFKRS